MNGMIAASAPRAGSLAARAAELRDAFDASFAAPMRADPVAHEVLLAIRVGTERCALRLAEIAGLFADRDVTPVPGRNAALLGVAGCRGVLVPVYSLRHLLGQDSAPLLRWFVLAAAAPIALAFDVFEGHVRAAAGAIVPRQSGHGGTAGEIVPTPDGLRSVLHLSAVIAMLSAKTRPDAATIEEE
jgi:purine-binding chemotaxis protein CheW